MDPLHHEFSESPERELSRVIGYRLLGWSIVTLWATTVVTLFRLFQDYPPAVDRWLLWVAPLLIMRSIGCVFIHKQLRAGVNPPSSAAMGRMSLLFGVSDGILLLSGAILLHSAGVSLLTLLFAITTLLALTAFVYMYTPWVAPATMALVIAPGTLLAIAGGADLPVELLISCVAVLAATCLGVNRFKSLYLRHLEDKRRYQNEIYQAAESNFIFNEHWQKMHVAAIDWDRDCIIRSWNPAAERLFGIPAAKAKGHSLDLLFDRETAADIRGRWLHATENEYEPPVLRSHDQLAKKPLTCWYDTPLFHEGELIGVASFVIDMSEQPVVKQRQAARSVFDILRFGETDSLSLASHKPLATGR